MCLRLRREERVMKGHHKGHHYRITCLNNHVLPCNTNFPLFFWGYFYVGKNPHFQILPNNYKMYRREFVQTLHQYLEFAVRNEQRQWLCLQIFVHFHTLTKIWLWKNAPLTIYTNIMYKKYKVWRLTKYCRYYIYEITLY